MSTENYAVVVYWVNLDDMRFRKRYSGRINKI